MSLIFGGGGKKQKPQFTGLSVQTSTSTVPVTQSWGYGRQSHNILWQADFEAHKHKQKSGKGLSGSGGVSYTYSASFVLSVGWGPFGGCDRVWKDQSKETSFSALGFTLIAGNIPQSPWGYLTSNHPAEALGYPGLGLFCAANYDLGQNNALGQHSFLMRRPLYNTAPGATGDADVALVTDDFLNSDINGVLVGDDLLDTDSLLSTADAPTTGDDAFQTYCTAMGFGFSPELESQESALEILGRWAEMFNTALIWTGYSVRWMPYGPDTITANGVTYLPDFTSRYTVTDDDFLRDEDSDPIRFRRGSTQDAKNSMNLEFKNRDNEYNPEPAPWVDQGLIDQFGPKPEETYTGHEIKEKSIALAAAAFIGRRGAYVRNGYDFALPPAYDLLEPGDIITCVDAELGTFDVMLTEIEEQEDDTLSMVSDEYFGSVNSTGATQSTDGTTNNPINTGVLASPVNTPMLFQPPPSLTDTKPQIWAAVSGGNPMDVTADPFWGGCEVHISTDAGVSYNMVGTIDAPCRMGELAAGLAAYGGTNPDTGNTLKVNTAMSDPSDFSDATVADAAAAVTLCRIAPEGANVEEYLSYTTATLNTADNWWFDDLYRGLYTSAPGAHAIGAQFARLDPESVFKYNFPLELIGETIYVKFVSFNIWKSGYEDIASVTAYSITIANAVYGTGLGDLNDVDLSTPPTDGQVLVWDDTAGKWVPGPAVSAPWKVTDTGTGASQGITIPYANPDENGVLVFVNGIRYETSEYSITGTTLTLTTNASGDTIEIIGLVQ